MREVVLALATLIPYYFINAEAGFACLSNPCIYGICIDELNRWVFKVDNREFSKETKIIEITTMNHLCFLAMA